MLGESPGLGRSRLSCQRLDFADDLAGDPLGKAFDLLSCFLGEGDCVEHG